MPRYFFHIRDGKDMPDDEGTELSCPEEACTQAVIATGEALRDLASEFWESEEWTMRVTDVTGAVIADLKCSGTRTLCAQPPRSHTTSLAQPNRPA